eukprot:gene16862-biopygen21834
MWMRADYSLAFRRMSPRIVFCRERVGLANANPPVACVFAKGNREVRGRGETNRIRSGIGTSARGEVG